MDWLIEIHHDRYYKWVPVPADSLREGDVAVDSYYGDDTKMLRQTVDEPTTSTSGGVSALFHEATNADRAEAGLAPRGAFSNFLRELEDGTWPRQFPVDSITKIVVLQGPPGLQEAFDNYVEVL